MADSAHITEIKLKNFKAFRDVKFSGLKGFNVVVGANGVGKSTLFDVFGFLKDCLSHNVRQALAIRGGFKEVISRGYLSETIKIELALRIKLKQGDRTVRYSIEISEEDNKVFVEKEVLQYTRFGGGQPYKFIDFKRGVGTAISNESEITNDQDIKRESQETDAPDILAIKGLGQFQKFEAASVFRSIIENWHVSDFHIQSARQSRDAGYAEHLSADGDNLALVAQFLFERHPDRFKEILKSMADRVPGISEVEAKETADGRIVLRFQDGSFKDPFISRFVSDGTLKMFAYLVLLNDPKPFPVLCVEEPENQLYPSLLGDLAEEFANYAQRGGQVFVSTHSPDFLDAVELDTIFVLFKRDGFTSVRRASDDENLVALVAEGDPPGRLWRQKLLMGADA